MRHFWFSLSIALISACKTAQTSAVSDTHGQNPVIDGTFVYLGSPSTSPVSSENVGVLLDDLNDMGMKTLLFSGVRSFVGECKTGSFQWSHGLPEKFGIILDEAQKHGMEVYIGVSQLGDICGSAKKYLQGARVGADIESMVKEIETTYGHHSALRGWYIPDEPGIQPPPMYPFYKAIVKAIRAQSKRPITIAPYLASALKLIGPKMVAAFAKGFKEATMGPDGQAVIQIWQDSVGATGVDLYWQRKNGNNVEEYFKAISSAIGRENFWSDNELFSCCVPPFSGTTYGPVTIARLQEQLHASRPEYVSKRVVWLAPKHMGSALDSRYKDASRLAASYKAVHGISGTMVRPVAYKWLTLPSSKYPDKGRELIDQQAADPKDYFHQSWVGIQGVAKLQVELADVESISYIAFQTLADTKGGITIPSSMKVICLDAEGSTIATETVERTLTQNDIRHEFTFANEQPFTFACKTLDIELSNGGWTFVGELEITRL